MDCPLYFVPWRDVTLQRLRESELADLVVDLSEDRQLALAEVGSGPGGIGGTVLAAAPEGAAVDGVGFYPDRQQWVQVSESVWCEPRTVEPEQLKRRACPAAEFENVVFSDGSLWQIPVLRNPIDAHGEVVFNSMDHQTSLPCTVYRERGGDWVRRVVDEYVELFDESRDWFDWLLTGAESGQRISFAYSDVFEFALRVVSLNYRYTSQLHSATRGQLMQSDQVSQVIRVACGWSVIGRMLDEKKKKLIGG